MSFDKVKFNKLAISLFQLVFKALMKFKTRMREFIRILNQARKEIFWKFKMGKK
jgi:hypothetical protein